MDNGRAVVAISHTKEKHRSPDRVLALVREAIDLLGGMYSFVSPGQTVLIKPNQTVYYSAEEGCTTDPLVVAALIRLAKEAGARRVQADVIISVPKAKNHHIEPISGALKNWVGVVNQQWRNHHHGDLDMIARFVDIMTVSRPNLCVVDALIAGEGDGPIANLPRWVGCILASTDPVATDVTICRLLGHEWQKLNFAKEAESRGLGVLYPIEYVGTPLESVAVEAWPGHKDFDYLPLNLLVGDKVTLPGTIGHVKSVLDSMLRRGELRQVIWLKGTPTIMIGEIDDPDFEEHLREGPYVVFDDAAKEKYKKDPRVFFIPGHPVLQTAMPDLMRGLGVALPGNAMMKWEQFERWGQHNLTYGNVARQTKTIAKPVGALLIGLAGLLMTAVLAKRLWLEQ